MIRRTVTLVELLLAIALLATIVIASAAVDLAARNFFRASERRVQLINELGFILEHIHKHASAACGWDGNRGIAITARRAEFRLDGGDPGSFSDDTWVAYRYVSGNNRLWFCDDWNVTSTSCNVNEEVLSGRIVANAGAGPLFNLTSSNTSLLVDITARYDPSEAAGFRRNPQVKLQTSIFFREHSFR